MKSLIARHGKWPARRVRVLGPWASASSTPNDAADGRYGRRRRSLRARRNATGARSPTVGLPSGVRLIAARRSGFACCPTHAARQICQGIHTQISGNGCLAEGIFRMIESDPTCAHARCRVSHTKLTTHGQEGGLPDGNPRKSRMAVVLHALIWI